MALHGCGILLVVVIGVLGLIEASRLRQLLESWINIHALFGLLLCGLVLVHCQWRTQYSPRMRPADIRALSRHLSRVVYLLLYIVIGVRLGVGIVDSIRHGGVLDVNLFGEAFRHDGGGKAFEPQEDFRLLLASGLVALVLVRVLAFRLSLRSVAPLGRP